MAPAEPRVDLLGLPRARLRQELAPWVDRPYRVEQIYQALNLRGVRAFAEMTDLGKDLRAQLAEHFMIGLPAVSSQVTSDDGTCKYLLELRDGATIEAVDIPEPGRRTFCISSQAGCALGCTFCVTGFWGAGRNLTAGEIVAQVLTLAAGRPLPASGLRLVFMGMGEPLLNLASLRPAIEILAGSISLRRITVSTAGVIPGIEELARWERRPNLAVSLHAPDDERRGKVMPINRTHPLADLIAVLRRYPLENGRRITFEYILIRDFNEAPADADQLVKLLSGLRAKVNLIPVNPDPVLGDRLQPPDARRIDAFRQRLLQRGMTATIRRRRGDDVSAACGQLRAHGRAPRGFRGRVKLETKTKTKS
ncbi:MAG TPA: 23S rRNA (adenine(2503)-C(2))-methyltransferase RlmN [Thermoanaerobaculia bacterium]|nr:23S rRNA (adenine(2503)-C(2))-methyltransferase RlmN [Thermoanaerobaculia bacterium]